MSKLGPRNTITNVALAVIIAISAAAPTLSQTLPSKSPKRQILIDANCGGNATGPAAPEQNFDKAASECRDKPLTIEIGVGGCSIKNSFNGDSPEHYFEKLADETAAVLNSIQDDRKLYGSSLVIGFVIFPTEPQLLLKKAYISPTGSKTRAIVSAALDSKTYPLQFAGTQVNMGGLGITNSFNHSRPKASGNSSLVWRYGGMHCIQSFDKQVLQKLPGSDFVGSQTSTVRGRPLRLLISTGGCSIDNSFNGTADVPTLCNLFIQRLSRQVPAWKISTLEKIECRAGGIGFENINE